MCLQAASKLHQEEGAAGMLTEREISLRWRELFRGAAIDDGVYATAMELIEALPATSPLRQRYASELADLRRLRSPEEPAKSKPSTRRRTK
jgi:phage terminase large subunit GpA-like protein